MEGTIRWVSRCLWTYTTLILRIGTNCRTLIVSDMPVSWLSMTSSSMGVLISKLQTSPLNLLSSSIWTKLSMATLRSIRVWRTNWGRMFSRWAIRAIPSWRARVITKSREGWRRRIDTPWPTSLRDRREWKLSYQSLAGTSTLTNPSDFVPRRSLPISTKNSRSRRSTSTCYPLSTADWWATLVSAIQRSTFKKSTDFS